MLDLVVGTCSRFADVVNPTGSQRLPRNKHSYHPGKSAEIRPISVIRGEGQIFLGTAQVGIWRPLKFCMALG